MRALEHRNEAELTVEMSARNREERYSKEESFDWFKTYEDLKPLLNEHITSKDARILMLGCGNSSM